MHINPLLVIVLQRMRDLCKKPLIINSGYRCEKHNAAEGGVYNSYHLRGKAADVATPPGLTPEKLAEFAEQAGADGIGIYPWGVHVDVRGYAARW